MVPHPQAPRRAIGIVRVSQTGGREGESFISPNEQRDRIAMACERDSLTLLDTIDELDVSGGTPLNERTGLRTAIEAVEAGRADVIVAAYFDRLVRSVSIQDELVNRVERAGGQVFAVDVGRVTNESAGLWLSGTMLGTVAEYHRRNAKERSREAQIRAVARGVLPWPNVPPGYVRGKSKILEPCPRLAPIVAQAFELRADGATISEVRAFLRRHGVQRSYHGVQALLRSRIVLGEIHFGDIVNLKAHEPIVDTTTWRRVQAISISRGRRAKSDRLLARLGVLRCGECGARMVIGTQTQGGRQYPFYRCPPVGDCERRQAISARIVEDVVVQAVRERIRDVQGRASVERDHRAAEATAERAQADLDAALRAFAGLEDEQAARERLAELREARDAARERVHRLGDQRGVVIVTAAADWDRLSFEERRALIRAVVRRVEVAPGRGASRVRVELLGE